MLTLCCCVDGMTSGARATAALALLRCQTPLLHTITYCYYHRATTVAAATATAAATAEQC
eukprot:15017-Heterococcus_DN1.PRE.2